MTRQNKFGTLVTKLLASAGAALMPTFALAVLATVGLEVAHPSITALAGSSAPVTVGTYQISCLMDEASGVQSCETGNQIPVGVELVLKAHVQDSSGNPAKRGSVIFQDCENGDPASSAACISGKGVWSHIITMSVDSNGNAEVDYGYVSHPATIGFRFRYMAQRSQIPNGESQPMDVTWF